MHTLTDSKATLSLCLAVVVSQICEITRNSTYSSSSKVIDYGASRKRICNFLLVINSNVGCISYRFRDWRIWLVFLTPPLSDDFAREESVFRISGWNLSRKN